MEEITFGSVCSGIEAASVAFGPLGWKAAWLSEIEPFPSAVLAHHYPNVPNLGDMTTLPDRVRSGEVEAPDVLCGGTPCQAFSVAGLRKSLDDDRGNLSLIFCELADEIDDAREYEGKEQSVIFWENVPGVLSTADNAFGCFLGALSATINLLNQAHDLNLEGTLSTGRGKKVPVSTAQSGRTRVLLLAPAAQPLGASWMPNISAWPNDAAVCSLSQVLETGLIPQRYFLSAKACAGILRRAAKRGKELPPALASALESVARQ